MGLEINLLKEAVARTFYSVQYPALTVYWQSGPTYPE